MYQVTQTNQCNVLKENSAKNLSNLWYLHFAVPGPRHTMQCLKRKFSYFFLSNLWHLQYLALAAQLPNVLFNWMNVFLQLRSVIASSIGIIIIITMIVVIVINLIFIIFTIITIGSAGI